MFYTLTKPVAICTALTLSCISPTLVGEKAAVAQTQPAASRAANTLLIAVDNNRLTQGMVGDLIANFQFLAGQRFTAKEAQRITQLAVAEFRKNPEKELEGYKRIYQIVSRLRELLTEGDMIGLADQRNTLLTNLYFGEFGEQEKSVKEILNVVYRYNPIVAADSTAKLVLTELDFKARVASDDFIAKLAGVKPSTSEFRTKYRQFLRQGFSKLPQATKKFLAEAETRWITLQVSYESLSPNQKKQYAADVRQSVKSFGVYDAARLKETTAIINNIGYQAVKFSELVVQSNTIQSTINSFTLLPY